MERGGAGTPEGCCGGERGRMAPRGPELPCSRGGPRVAVSPREGDGDEEAWGEPVRVPGAAPGDKQRVAEGAGRLSLPAAPRCGAPVRHIPV